MVRTANGSTPTRKKTATSTPPRSPTSPTTASATSPSRSRRTAPRRSPANTSSGTARVWTWNGAWNEQAKLTEPVGPGEEEFGSDVSLSASGSKAMILAFGGEGVVAYEYTRTGSTWSQQGEGIQLPFDSEFRSAFYIPEAVLSAEGDTALLWAKWGEQPEVATDVASVSLGPVGNLATKSVTLKGTVDPVGETVSSCHFEDGALALLRLLGRLLAHAFGVESGRGHRGAERPRVRGRRTTSALPSRPRTGLSTRRTRRSPPSPPSKRRPPKNRRNRRPRRSAASARRRAKGSARSPSAPTARTSASHPCRARPGATSTRTARPVRASRGSC